MDIQKRNKLTAAQQQRFGCNLIEDPGIRGRWRLAICSSSLGNLFLAKTDDVAL